MPDDTVAHVLSMEELHAGEALAELPDGAGLSGRRRRRSRCRMRRNPGRAPGHQYRPPFCFLSPPISKCLQRCRRGGQAGQVRVRRGGHALAAVPRPAGIWPAN